METDGSPSMSDAVSSAGRDAEQAAGVKPRKPGTFTSESARAAAQKRHAGSAQKQTDADASDAAIEKALMQKALTDPRAAEVLIRWRAQTRANEQPGGDELPALEDMDTQTLEALRAQCLRMVMVLSGQLAPNDEERSWLVSVDAMPPEEEGAPPRTSESRAGEVSGEPHAARDSSAPPRTYDEPPPPRETPAATKE